MERNMTATVFDASAHCYWYRKMWGAGLQRNILKPIESDPLIFMCDGSIAAVVYYAKILGIKVNNRKRKWLMMS